MSDKFDKNTRSEIMRKVLSKNNKSTEKKILILFHMYDIKGWRRGYPVIGRPDFVFLQSKVAIFVDGCFWHGHKCKTIPEDNREYWEKKINKNKLRDLIITKRFQKRGWRVVRIWECEIRKKNFDSIAKSIISMISDPIN